MIHMLSRFDLKTGHSPDTFIHDYQHFCDRMVEKDLALSTGKVGRRVRGTPMDTDDAGAPEYYVVMTFSDRQQLDRAYAYIAGSADDIDLIAHRQVHNAVVNPVFTCWQDE